MIGFLIQIALRIFAVISTLIVVYLIFKNCNKSPVTSAVSIGNKKPKKPKKSSDKVKVAICEKCKIKYQHKSLCSGCNQTCYCSKECLAADRPNHKTFCKHVSSPATKSDTLFEQTFLRDCERGYLFGVRSAIERGVKVNKRFFMVDQLTPLYFTCVKGHTDCLLLLLKHGAYPNLGNFNRLTALHVACEYGHTECVSILLQHGADPNLCTKDDRITALHMACQNGHEECTSLLLQHDANPNSTTLLKQKTPLYAASQYGHHKCVLLMLEKGALVDMSIDNGETPLIAACLIGNLKCVVLLIKHGADINRSDENGNALIASCYTGRTNIVLYLLQQGADICIKSKSGPTAVQMAFLHGHQKCVDLLIEYGADINSLDDLVFGIDREFYKDDEASYKDIRRSVRYCEYPQCTNNKEDCNFDICTGCNLVHYCSKEHQKLHWPEHKKICKLAK